MNSVFWMSLVMSLFGCAGLLLVGKGKWQGWVVNLAAQPVWFVFAIVTHAYALVISAILYTYVFSKSLRLWLTQRP